MKDLASKSILLIGVWSTLLIAAIAPATAQSCMTADDMDTATRTALTSTAQRYFGMVTQGDVASLRQNTIPSLAANFGGIEAAVTDSKANLQGVQPAPRSPYC